MRLEVADGFVGGVKVGLFFGLTGMMSCNDGAGLWCHAHDVMHALEMVMSCA